MRRGYSQEEAKQKISERQKTFSYEKCIEKYGETKGKEIWKKRQEKWLASFYDKSSEIIQEINVKKGKRKDGSPHRGRYCEKYFSMVENKIDGWLYVVEIQSLTSGEKFTKNRNYCAGYFG